ncbi:MAG TPA: PH domain-containing protein [Pseudonocardiaceae bacterium]|jgi:hypothetical protein|nr:PH domain-containing protein [Pseudonocardiaceae bacterium]
MDRDSPRTAWSPRPVVVVLGWVFAAAALAWTLLGSAPAGRLLTGVATVALVLLASHGSAARPRLAADDTGVTVRQLTTRRHWPWRSVKISVTRFRRFGRQVALLEVDGDDDDGVERLVVLGWLDLGAEPHEVYQALRRLRPHDLRP